ncbi:50S ribosomal protein L21 [Candidatus Daviesbacteria bacterium RIFCSPLOWO2_02_FULL_36_7]|uniref:50S ribosomal protein L21 n=1 Tax=Candidatus Daviesbacteria bacterium RIFCSPLOWO2_02_FULL_36_7 TaxID=1797792 RepID=A0A1F5MHA4_9BACT|nr:MAG: 50S ribosomal protein L21 [Candidatus Daviesbacteria bacterium RIFCSPLOWO2_02_FULL_36_7]
MLNYAICEISGKQYKVVSGQTFEVSLQQPGDNIEANVLLLSEDDKLQIGKPFLKEKLTLKRVEDIKGEKIRVSKFHAKANFRKTRGYRSKITKVVLGVKKAS